MPAAFRLTRLSCGGSGTLRFATIETSRRRLPRVGVVLTGASPWTTWIDAAGAEGRALHSPKRDHVPPHVSPMMLAHSSGTMLMDGHKAPMKARFPRPTASRPFLLQTTRHTKIGRAHV